MLDLNQKPHTYDEAVDLLAAWQGGDTPESISIYLLRDPEMKTVQFVEVSWEFGDDDKLRPVTMGSSSDFPFRSSILLISQSDWERVQKSEKALPEGWDLGKLELVWPIR